MSSVKRYFGVLLKRSSSHFASDMVYNSPIQRAVKELVHIGNDSLVLRDCLFGFEERPVCSQDVYIGLSIPVNRDITIASA